LELTVKIDRHFNRMSELLHLIDWFVKIAKLPYTHIYGPYKRRNDENDVREIGIVVLPDGSRKTKSWPKLIMEQRLGRELDVNETIDHQNFDPLDNSPENLVIRPRSEHSSLDTRRVKLVSFKCPECNGSFQRSPRRIRDKAGKQGPFCSRTCAAKYTRKVQLGQADKAPIQQSIPSEYYRRKMVELAGKLIDKYDLRKTS
jgi:HNH endonuclease